MRYNWLDFVLLAVVATVAGVQFLRSTKDFSRVLYEALLLIGALVATNALFKRAHDLTHISYAVCFLAVFLVFGTLAILLAAAANAGFAFSMGAFNYILGLILALACAYVIGHVAIRTPHMAFAHKNPVFFDTVERSLMARDLLRFRTFIEILAMLRVARWLHV